MTKTLAPPQPTGEELRHEADVAEGVYARWLVGEIRRKDLRLRVASRLRRELLFIPPLVALPTVFGRPGFDRWFYELLECSDDMAGDRDY